jgi:hypothetical protein
MVFLISQRLPPILYNYTIKFNKNKDVNENIIGSNKTYTVNRKDITNRDLFTCVITDTIT